ncbi:DUF4382 domain-containing protein [Sulfurovum riftiae]|uniref:DUF4382 domain-containing protein n=1 Tax=Sulfurovum riftiae TaxID=1630136 RepID=A0A151CHE4_9BACT|nr:DUF4382 domain-containing protein [Sulfurovum riftiae]KYJ86854.1 hypothetical protein AS592_08495 [Sulfurovum riftiae]
MKYTKTLIAVLFSLLILPLIIGCGGGGSSSTSASTSTGIMSLSITDAPPMLGEDVTEVNIAIIGIEYNKDGKWVEAEDFEGPQVFNLLELQDGNSLHMGDLILPAGHYKELRFKLAAPENPSDVRSNPDCNITFADGTSVPLFVPSGSSSGFKAKGEFDITANAKIEITADFDVHKSIVVAGASGKYLLKPVIRIVVTELSGGVEGNIVDIADYDPTEDALIVFAYEDGTYNSSEDGTFAGSVSSAEVDMESGEFTLAFLEEGTYDLVVAQYAGATFTDVVAVKENVEVTKGTEVSVDINTSAL